GESKCVSVTRINQIPSPISSAFRQRDELFLISRNDIEASRLPFLLGLFDALLRRGDEIPPDVALRAKRGSAEKHEMRTDVRRYDDLVTGPEHQQPLCRKD